MPRQSRREFLASAAVAASVIPAYRGEFTRYLDPLTETAVTRLTTPASTALLPDPQNRAISYRDRFLICSSNRSGVFAPYRLDLRSGVLAQLASPGAMDPRSLSMDIAEKSVYFLDGNALTQFSFATKRSRMLSENVAAFRIQSERSGFVLLKSGTLQDRSGKVLVNDVSALIAISPDAGRCLVQRGQSVCILNASGTAAPLILTQEPVQDVFWASDSQTVLFLRDNLIRQVSIGSPATEVPLVPRTPFASFSPNTDDSVFVGASRSRAQPAVLLVLRQSQRELVLCEHHASQPEQVSPVFSPDSHRVYFQSDRDGHSAIYSVNTESLIEKT